MRRLAGYGAVCVLVVSGMALALRTATADSMFLTPVVADQQGKVLGPMLTPDHRTPTVAIKLRPGEPRVSIAVQQIGNHGFEPRDVGLFWLTKDCSGTAFLSWTVPNRAGLDFPTDGRTFWYPSPAETPVAHQAMSYHYSGRCIALPNVTKPFSVTAKSIDITTLGFQPPLHFDLEDTSASTPPTPSPYLIDSRNKVIGPILSLGSSDVVVVHLKPAGGLVVLAVDGDGLKRLPAPIDQSYLYESADCTGPAYVPDFTNWIKQAWADPNDPKTILYVGSTSKKVTIRSENYGYRCDKMGTPWTLAVDPVLSAATAAQGFQQPFVVKLR